MIEDIRYPLGAIFIACWQPLGNTPIYASSAHIVVHIAKLGEQLSIYVMYRVMVIDCSLRYISYSLFHFSVAHNNSADTQAGEPNICATFFVGLRKWLVVGYSLAYALGRVAPVDIH